MGTLDEEIHQMTNKTNSNHLPDNLSQAQNSKKHKDGNDNPKNLLGPNLRAVRCLRGMSQQDVVNLINAKGHTFTTSTASKIETQDRSLYDTELVHFLEIYSITLADLISVSPDDNDSKNN